MNNDNNRKHNLIRWNLQIKQKHLRIIIIYYFYLYFV